MAHDEPTTGTTRRDVKPPQLAPTSYEVAAEAQAARTLTMAEITAALTALALCAGSPKHAAIHLKGRGLELSEKTLKEFRDTTHRDLYQRITTEYAVRLEDLVVREARELAVAAARVERLAIEQTEAALERGNIRDPSKAALDMSRVKSSNLDKLLILTNRPTAINVNTSAADLIRALEADRVIRRVVPDSAPVPAPAIDATNG